MADSCAGWHSAAGQPGVQNKSADPRVTQQILLELDGHGTLMTGPRLRGPAWQPPFVG